MIRSAISAAALVIVSAAATAAPTTWSINQPWDFYTSSNPAQGNLVGTITFDRSVSEYYPVSWSFTLQHHDPLFTPYYPLTITGSYPNASNYQHTGWLLWGGPNAQDYLALTLNLTAENRDHLLDGTAPSLNFAAYEYVYRGWSSSTRQIYIQNGQMTLVPAPAAAGLLGAGLVLARRRRR